MHDDGLGVQPSCTSLIETKRAGVFTEGRKVAARLAFVLDAEEHHDLGIGEGGLQFVRDLRAEGGKPVRHEGGGADERDGGAEFHEGVDVGACDAAEEDVAEDDDLAAPDRSEVFQHGKGIE